MLKLYVMEKLSYKRNVNRILTIYYNVEMIVKSWLCWSDWSNNLTVKRVLTDVATSYNPCVPSRIKPLSAVCACDQVARSIKKRIHPRQVIVSSMVHLQQRLMRQ